MSVSKVQGQGEGGMEKRTNVRKALAAPNVRALMGLFSSVSADVDGERTPLDEALATTGRHARVGPLISVYPVVALQI